MALLSTDLEMVAYLKLTAESLDLWIPALLVHQVQFWEHRPQKLAKTFKADTDGSWYFLSPWAATPILFNGWEVLETPTFEKRVYVEGYKVAFKYQLHFVDDNNQEWRMCVYRLFDPVDGQLRNERLARLYQHSPEAINRNPKGWKRKAPARDKFMPTHEDACAYLKMKIESLSLSIPGWVVHELDFWKYTPQQLAETYEPARDQVQTWYFVSRKPPMMTESRVDWKKVDFLLREFFIYRVNRPVGLKFRYEFLDENNQKWDFWFYRIFSTKEKVQLNPWVLAKLTKHVAEVESRSPYNLRSRKRKADR